MLVSVIVALVLCWLPLHIPACIYFGFFFFNIDIPDVMKSELAVDPRWAPNVYRQMLFNLKTCLEEDNNEGDQMADQLVSYKIEKLGNK